ELRDREARQTDQADVDERVLARSRTRNDEAAKGREVVGTGVARRNDRRRALMLDQLVGGDADRRAVRIRVAMQVDQTRRHQLAADVHDAGAALGSDRRRNRLDLAVADADVALARQALA